MTGRSAGRSSASRRTLAVIGSVSRNQAEDEYSFVLEGRFGVQLGEEVLEAGRGDLLVKPRGLAHAFWNGGDEPARLLELISPAGFEHYFRELAPLLAAAERDEAAIGEVVARYRLDIDFTTIPTLAQRHNLRLGQRSSRPGTPRRRRSRLPCQRVRLA
jgi:Cupin domain